MRVLPELHINLIGGNCPVQAEGVLSGEPFYFRARGNHWSLSVGGDVVCSPDWFFQEQYGDEPFAAGWMTTDEAIAFIRRAAELYLSREIAHDDGQPDEVQEWIDYDHDC